MKRDDLVYCVLLCIALAVGLKGCAAMSEDPLDPVHRQIYLERSVAPW